MAFPSVKKRVGLEEGLKERNIGWGSEQRLPGEGGTHTGPEREDGVESKKGHSRWGNHMAEVEGKNKQQRRRGRAQRENKEAWGGKNFLKGGDEGPPHHRPQARHPSSPVWTGLALLAGAEGAKARAGNRPGVSRTGQVRDTGPNLLY